MGRNRAKHDSEMARVAEPFGATIGATIGENWWWFDRTRVRPHRTCTSVEGEGPPALQPFAMHF
jgi:hypothetical protein